VAEVTETQLPGVGVRYEFRAGNGDVIGVVHHHGGRREVLVYDRHDPDRAQAALDLTDEDTRTLTDVLGATQVTETLGAVQQRIEGLALDWVDIPPTSPLAGHTIGEGRAAFPHRCVGRRSGPGDDDVAGTGARVRLRGR
jgi:TrkA domain protein